VFWRFSAPPAIVGCSADTRQLSIGVLPRSQRTSWADCGKFGGGERHPGLRALINQPGTARPRPFDLLLPPSPGDVLIAVYDAHGALVRVLFNATEPATSGTFRTRHRWDLTDEHGARVPHGDYRVYMRVGDICLSSSDVRDRETDRLTAPRGGTLAFGAPCRRALSRIRAPPTASRRRSGAPARRWIAASWAAACARVLRCCRKRRLRRFLGQGPAFEQSLMASLPEREGPAHGRGLQPLCPPPASTDVQGSWRIRPPRGVRSGFHTVVQAASLEGLNARGTRHTST